MVNVGDMVVSAIERRRQLSRSPSDANEPFEVDCSCGTSISGFRRGRFAELQCPNCGASVYVQPRNPRRSPKPHRRQQNADWPPSNAPPRRTNEPRRRVMIDTPPEQSEPSPSDTFARLRHHLFLRAHATWETIVAKIGTWRRPRVTRLQLTVVAVAVLVVSTAAWQWDRFRQQHFAKDLVTYTALGIESLGNGEFSTARDQLRRADRAARGLRGQSPRQRTARQLYRESIVWSSLAIGSIHRLTTAADGRPPVDPRQWPEQFHERFQGRSLIFDARVSRFVPYLDAADEGNEQAEPGAKNSPERSNPRTALRLEWAAIAPDARIEVRLPDVAAFAAIEAGETRRLLFGARLAGLEPSPDEAGLWLLELEPESCTLLTLLEPLEHLGWPDVAGLRSLITQQAGDAGVAYK